MASLNNASNNEYDEGTISYIKDEVIPALVDISNDFRCRYTVKERATVFKEDLEGLLCVLEHNSDHMCIKDLLTKLLNVSLVSALSDDTMYWQLQDILTRLRNRDSPASILPVHAREKKDTKDRAQKGKTIALAMEPSPLLENPSAFQEFTQIYEMLDPLHKLCLLCFSAFSEGAEISRRTIIYWWIGEQLIEPPAAEDDGEKYGHEILDILVEYGFLERVITKGRVTNRCKVRPFVRSVLVYIAKAEHFFDYLVDKEYYHDNLDKHRVCLVKAAEKRGSLTSSSTLQLLRSHTIDLEHIDALLNVNKCYLDIKLHWFSKMKNIKALYLGRCDSKAIQHIEVKSSKFLAGLTHMKGLRLLSLQGISKILRIPDSIGELKDLKILDLRDCQDLKELPEEIKSLEKLTNMDLTGCYSLVYMPKGISSLTNLQVLKGFTIREVSRQQNSCSFHDLKRLKNIRKLSISSFRNFPEIEDFKVFNAMEKLCKLTIAWQRLYKKHFVDRSATRPTNMPFLDRLEKLDLQHIPYEGIPEWLMPEKLLKLKKLYIKGGKHQWIELYTEHKVETLRLLYIRPGPQSRYWYSNDYLEHFRSIPELRYLEIKFGPDDYHHAFIRIDGVWRRV